MILRILLVSVAAMFLNGEYYKYGITLFKQPLLFLLYVSYVTMVDDAIRRFSLGCREVFLVGAIFGLVIEGFFTRSFYADPPYVLGVNWITVFIQIVYWGLITSVLAFYLGNKFVPRTSQKPILSRIGWIIIAAWWVFIFTVWGTNLPPLREMGIFPVSGLIILMVVALIILTKRKSEKRISIIEKSLLLDLAISVHFIVELGVGSFISQVMVWVWILAGLALGLVTSFFVFGKTRLSI